MAKRQFAFMCNIFLENLLCSDYTTLSIPDGGDFQLVAYLPIKNVVWQGNSIAQ